MFESTKSRLGVPPERARLIVRQRVHDFRNSLNGLNLYAQLLGEMSEDPDNRQIVTNMQTQLQELETSIKWLSLQFADPSVSVIAAYDLIMLWQQQLKGMQSPQREIAWSIRLKTEAIATDLRAVSMALRELSIEAWKRSPGCKLQAEAAAEDGHLCLTLTVLGGAPLAVDGAIVDIGRLLEDCGASFEVNTTAGGSTWNAKATFPLAS